MTNDSLPFLSLAEAEQAAAEADQVAVAQRVAALDGPVVDERPGRRAHVFQEIAVARQDDVGVQALNRGVAEQANVARLGAAHGRPLLGQDLLPARPEAGL